jgi:hypothetical protein
MVTCCAIAGAANETAIAEAIKLFFIENLLKVEQTAAAFMTDTPKTLRSSSSIV